MIEGQNPQATENAEADGNTPVPSSEIVRCDWAPECEIAATWANTYSDVRGWGRIKHYCNVHKEKIELSELNKGEWASI